MNIQPVTVNTQPAIVVLPAGSASAQPEVKTVKAQGTEIRADTPVADKAQVTENSASNAKETEQQVRDAVDSIGRFVTKSAPGITFSIDKDDGFVVKIVDSTSHEVIRQIPSKEAIAIAKALEKLQGLFVRDKV